MVGQTGGSIAQKMIQPASTPTNSSTFNTNNKLTDTYNKDIRNTLTGESKSSANDDWYRNSRKEPLAGGRCVLKRLYINDADEKRKKVECLMKVQLANGLMLGTLSSRGIKVISKPSKKRQSVKNIERKVLLSLCTSSIINLFIY